MTLPPEVVSYLLIAFVVGLIVGWFFTWLVSRSRGKKYQANIQELDSKLADANSSLSQVKAQAQKLDTRAEGRPGRRGAGQRQDRRSGRRAVCVAG